MADPWVANPKFTRKIWWIATMLLCALPLVFPFSLPIPVSGRTVAFYDEYAELPEGSVIMWGITGGLQTYYTQRDFWDALLESMAELNHKIIFTCFSGAANLFGEVMFNENDVQGRYGYEYGVDYVVMPFTPGQEMGMSSIAAVDGFWKAYTADSVGNPIESLPIFSEVRDLGSVDLIMIQYMATEFGPMMVRQFSIKWDIPAIAIGQFYAIGEFWGTYVFGNLDGTLAMAEFEYFRGVVGEEIQIITMRDTQAILVIAILFVGFGVDAYRQTKGEK